MPDLKFFHELPLPEILRQLEAYEPTLLRFEPRMRRVFTVTEGATVTAWLEESTINTLPWHADNFAIRLMRRAEELGWHPLLHRTFDPGEWRCEILSPGGHGWMIGKASGEHAVLHAVASAMLTLHEALAGKGGWAE